MPWINRTVLDGMIERAAYLHADLVAAKVYSQELKEQVAHERARAENAVDELLKIKVQADPISPEAVVRQRVNPAEMDNMFEDEDEDAVKRLLERAEAVGVQTIYSEALEEQNES